VKKEKMSLKLQAWQGLLVVIVILGITGGALQLAASELQQNPDLTTWMGAYQVPFIAFLQNSWLIIIVTFIYNIFMYFRQNQLAALKQTTELFQLQKFTATLAWFIGILGPMAALISDKELQGIIAFSVVMLTAFLKELQNMYSNQTILPPVTPGSPSSSPQTPAQSSTSTPGIPQPSTPSDIPSIPSVPATVFINGIVAIKAVIVDGQAYPLSNVSGTVKASQWTSVKVNNQTILSIAFSDYVIHDVEIDYDTTGLKLKLASGSIWPPA